MNRAAFFTALRKRESKLFGTSLSQKQVTGIDGILDAFETHGDGRAKTLAYALATAYHETGKAMVPIKETVMPYHKDKNPTDAQVIGRLDRWARKISRTSNIYWRVNKRTGKAYFGRGHVQLTWISNYSGSSADAGFDLVAYPDKMLVPEISARVLFKGLLDGRWNGHGKGIAFYLPTGFPADLEGARRTVNVTDEWETIAGHYKAFLTAIEASGGVVPQKPVIPDIHPAVDVPDDPEPSNVLGSIIAILLNLLKGFRK